MQKYINTVFIRSGNADQQAAQFCTLKVGQWVTGLSLDNQSGLYRGQYMGMDNNDKPIINLRLDNVKSPLNWKAQFKSNKPLRDFARIKC